MAAAMPTPRDLLLDPVSLTVAALRVLDLTALGTWGGAAAGLLVGWTLLSSLSPRARRACAQLFGPAALRHTLWHIPQPARDFAVENGFYPGASSRVPEMLLMRDVSQPRFP
jgi:hypothetical protein